MLRKLLASGFVLATSAYALPIVRASVPDARCTDDRGVDRCAEAQQQRVRAAFGMQSIDEHQAAGDQVRRAFYVDGYGQDLIAIAFVRPRGRDPVVRVHFPRTKAGVHPPPLEVPVGQAVWREVIDRSTTFDRDLAPIVGANALESLCLHSWVYTIEATDPELPGFSKTKQRRKVVDACGDEPGATYAEGLSRIAFPLLPHCAVLDLEQHRNDTSALAACNLLTGDRMAAAEVLNAARAFQPNWGVQDTGRLSAIFDYKATVDWNGIRNEGTGSAAAFWVEQIGKSSQRTRFSYQAVNGENANRIRLLGTLSRSIDLPDGRSRYENARVEQIWKRRQGGNLQVGSVTVGPWQAQPDL